ncbi:MAG TPA: hypothetical protein VFV38_22130 [Ktedonobacteraceae bacterium]|nr:hypothetical protein [Ktedonobacteraceae bacterium]
MLGKVMLRLGTFASLIMLAIIFWLVLTNLSLWPVFIIGLAQHNLVTTDPVSTFSSILIALGSVLAATLMALLFRQERKSHINLKIGILTVESLIEGISFQRAYRELIPLSFREARKANLNQRQKMVEVAEYLLDSGDMSDPEKSLILALALRDIVGEPALIRAVDVMRKVEDDVPSLV